MTVILKSKSKSSAKPAKKKNSRPKIVKSASLVVPPVPSIPALSKHEIVAQFLRTWSGMHGIDHGTKGDASCDSIMSGILTYVTKRHPREFQNFTCANCRTPAPFLTMLGLQPGGPIFCLKCQGIEDLKARIQDRILPLKPDRLFFNGKFSC